MSRPKKDYQLTGQRFGLLTVLGPAPDRARYWRCRCDCGSPERRVNQYLLIRNETVSCGCISRLRLWEMNQNRVKHGMRNTPVYRTWNKMRNRCNNANDDKYHLYGGRGIKMCDRWDDFLAFYEDMGDRPLGMSLDRIDNDGNYEPRNCRWITQKQQCNNRRGNRLGWHDGKLLTASEIADLTGEPYHKVGRRLRREQGHSPKM